MPRCGGLPPAPGRRGWLHPSCCLPPRRLTACRRQGPMVQALAPASAMPSASFCRSFSKPRSPRALHVPGRILERSMGIRGHGALADRLYVRAVLE